MGFLLSGAKYERVSIRTINSSHVGRTSLHGSYSLIGWTVMNYLVLLGNSYLAYTSQIDSYDFFGISDPKILSRKKSVRDFFKAIQEYQLSQML